MTSNPDNLLIFHLEKCYFRMLNLMSKFGDVDLVQSQKVKMVSDWILKTEMYLGNKVIL